MQTVDQKIIATAQTINHVLTQIGSARYSALSRSVYASLDLIHEISDAGATSADEYDALVSEKRRAFYETLSLVLTDAETWLVSAWIFPSNAFTLCRLDDAEEVARYAQTSRDYIEEVAKALTAEEVYQVRCLRGRDLDEALASTLGEDYRAIVDYSMVDAEIDRLDACY